MITFENLSKNFGSQDVLCDVSFTVNRGERVGVVGPNGSGKSTLFSLITGDMTPDSGNIVLPRRIRLGHLRQQLKPHAVKESLFEFAENALPELRTIEHEIHALESSLGAQGRETEDKAQLRRLGELQTRFEALGGYEIRHRTESVLSGLGFDSDDFARPFKDFSGGWQLRAELARVLVAEPELILLDEPTNYLDTPAVEWLQKRLREFDGTIMLISHDRYLLNSLTNVTIEISATRAERYTGNYDTYVKARVQRRDQLAAERKNQDRRRQQIERFVERFRAKNTKASQVQSRVKQLARMQEVRLAQPLATRGTIRLKPPPHCGREVVRLEDVGLTYDNQRWVLRHLDLRMERGDRFALVGRNGLGKTTLLRMLAGNLTPSEGKRYLGHKVVVGYQSQEFSRTMSPGQSVFDTVKAVAGDSSEQEVRTLLGGFGFSGDDVQKPVDVLSGGEKVRLAFAGLLANPPNLLLLDEPTTHLDVAAREALEQALSTFQGTLCVVSHDIDFLCHVATSIIALDPPGYTRYWGGYEYYREKIEGREPPGDADRPQAENPDDRKVRRRERALRRQAVSGQRRELQTSVRTLESKVAVLESEQQELLERLDPQNPGGDPAVINRRLSEIHCDLVAATRDWEEAALKLEDIEQDLRSE